MSEHALARDMVEDLAIKHMMSEEDVERILKAWFEFNRKAAKKMNK